MKTKVLQFVKSDHFMLRQWERNIEDTVLEAVLQWIGKPLKGKALLIARESDVKRAGWLGKKISWPSGRDLLLWVDRKVLITGFFVSNLHSYLKSQKVGDTVVSDRSAIIPSVNYHLTKNCNMSCGYCFARYNDAAPCMQHNGMASREESLGIVRSLVSFGFRKITFAGGEPTLCPWLPELICEAKAGGMVTMIVSNGSGINDDFLHNCKGNLDWIGLSVDSMNPSTNLSIGRAISGRGPMDRDKYFGLAEKINSAGYRLKINTVVNRYNKDEDLSGFIRDIRPERWKLFQVLPIAGQNDNKIDRFKVTDEEFGAFVKRHEWLETVTRVVPESNNDIKASYVMVDPYGRFYDNAEGRHKYSDPISLVGIQEAYSQVSYDQRKFMERDGNYFINQ